MNMQATRASRPAWRPDASMNRQFLRASADDPPLRIGLVCDNGRIPRYTEQVIEDIHGCDFARLHCMIDWQGASAKGGTDEGGFSTLLYRLYQKIVAPLFADTTADALEPVPPPTGNGEPLFAGPVFRIGESGGSRFSAMIERIACMELDVIINLAAPELDPALATIARHGVWYFRLDGHHPALAATPLIRNTLENRENTANIALLRRTRAGEEVLRSAAFATTPALSMRQAVFAPCFGSSWFVIDRLAELHRNRRLAGQTPPPPQASGAPDNRQLIAFAGRQLRGALRRMPARLRGARVEVDWKIALRMAESPLPHDSETRAIAEFRWLRNPPGHFWADPFLLRHEGRTWLFFEDYDRLRDKGQIACAEVDADGNIGPVFTALEKPWHLSYPQVFVHDGEIYMVPESVEHQTVDLYRARHFPHDWVHEKQLLDVAVVDATLTHHDGRWWMFASPMPVAGHAPITCLWSADTLTGEWRLAPTAVVSSDVRHARNAGAILAEGQRAYRVSQDCSVRYGAALWFNRIERWDERDYRETPERRISGNSITGLTGIHSYNRAGDIEAIDGRFEITLDRNGTPLREQFPKTLD